MYCLFHYFYILGPIFITLLVSGGALFLWFVVGLKEVTHVFTKAIATLTYTQKALQNSRTFIVYFIKIRILNQIRYRRLPTVPSALAAFYYYFQNHQSLYALQYKAVCLDRLSNAHQLQQIDV